MSTLNLTQRVQRMQQGTNLTANDLADIVDTQSGLSQLSGVKDVTNTGAGKIAGGSANFVSGAATIATGLTTITSFQVEISATGFATGATEVTMATVSGAIATGSVTIQGFRLATTTASASGTGLFYWLAYGT